MSDSIMGIKEKTGLNRLGSRKTSFTYKR